MKTYDAVADKVGLKGLVRDRFLRYMKKRWGEREDETIKCVVGYAEEWALRFQSGMEWAASDFEGRTVLWDVDQEVSREKSPTLS